MNNLNKNAALLFCAFLASCTPLRAMHQANEAVKQTQSDITDTRYTQEHSAPPVIVHEDFYADRTLIPTDIQPAWLKRPIHLQAQAMPFNLLVQRITGKTNIPVTYDSSVDPGLLITLQYQGNTQGALTILAAKTGYAYQLEHNQLSWSAFIDKTFEIAFMPGSTQYLVGQTSGAANTSNNNSSNNGSNSNVVTTRNNLNGEQYSNLRARLSLWDDITKTLDKLKSADGKVIVSEATTSVTVHDHPANVSAITHYLTQLNADLSKQVRLQVQVINVELNDDYNLGIDWRLVTKALSTQLAFSANLASAANLMTNLANGASGNSGLATFSIGKASSQAILNALSEQGKLRVVTQPSVVTMNNQMAEIRITRDTGYLQSVSTTSTNQLSTSQTLTPGIVTDGFTLYLLPKIQDSHVFLQISSTLSTLTSLTKVSNRSNDDSTEAQTIQVPTLAEKQFNQRTIVDSGATLMITGFKQLSDQVKSDTLAGIEPLGGHSSKTQNIQTIVLITPIIIDNGVA